MGMIKLTKYAVGALINPNFNNYQSTETAPQGSSTGDARKPVLINPDLVATIESVQTGAGGGAPAGEYYRINLLQHSTRPGNDRPDWFIVNQSDMIRIANKAG